MIAAARLALLSDVHANPFALKAALDEAQRRGADTIAVCGDHSWGPLPVETLALLRGAALPAVMIRGNADREVIGPLTEADGIDADSAALAAWDHDQLPADALTWLAQLPASATVTVEGLGDLLICHGSPRSDEERMGLPDLPEEALAAMLTGVAQPLVACGHTHVQLDRAVGAKRVINPGSIGLPVGAVGAHWALLGAEGVEHVVTPYDVVAAGAAFRSAGGPFAADFAAHVAAPPASY